MNISQFVGLLGRGERLSNSPECLLHYAPIAELVTKSVTVNPRNKIWRIVLAAFAVSTESAPLFKPLYLNEKLTARYR